MPHEVTEADVSRARKIAAAYARKTGTLNMADEWASAAVYGLATSALAFDSDINPDFWVFARRRVAGAVMDCMRSWNPKGFNRATKAAARRAGVEWTPAPISESIYGPPGTFSHTDWITSDELEVGWEAEYHDEVEVIAARLPGRVGDVFKAYYTRTMNTGRAAAIAGVGKSRGSQCMALAYKLLTERPAGPSEKSKD